MITVLHLPLFFLRIRRFSWMEFTSIVTFLSLLRASNIECSVRFTDIFTSLNLLCLVNNSDNTFLSVSSWNPWLSRKFLSIVFIIFYLLSPRYADRSAILIFIEYFVLQIFASHLSMLILFQHSGIQSFFSYQMKWNNIHCSRFFHWLIHFHVYR